MPKVPGRKVADPHCDVCGSKKVWIGIGPGADAECPNACTGGPECPECGSINTEPFKRASSHFFWTPIPAEPKDEYHCWPCGHVWEVK